jgi:hypothetical protein
MRASTEVSIDLTAQDLLSLPDPQVPAANLAQQPALEDTVEIELTAEQMDALLSAGSLPAGG